MREILFRGRRLDTGKWVDGYLLVYADGCSFICREDYIKDVLNKYRIDPATVGQFTGEVDRAGKWIFEGDIVRAHDTLLRCDEPYHEFTGIVDFADGSFVIRGEYVTHYRWLDYECDVIGNIWDNPELLEARDDD